MTAPNRLAVPGRRAGDFWIFWTGQTISQIGSALTSTALALLVFKLSGSALDLGLASAATWVPYPLFGLFIGAWVDRVNRKGLMIGLDICRAVVLAVLPGLSLLGHVPIWWIYLVTFINSTLTIGFQSATTAAIPSMVAQDSLVKANGRIQASAPNQLLGRVLTFTSVLAIFSVPFSSILAGLVIDQVKNVVLVFGVLGVFLVGLSLVFVRSPLTRVEGYLPPAQAGEAAR